MTLLKMYHPNYIYKLKSNYFMLKKDLLTLIIPKRVNEHQDN